MNNINNHNPTFLGTITPEFRVPTGLVLGHQECHNETPMPTLIRHIPSDTPSADNIDEQKIEFFSNRYRKLYPATGLTQNRVSGFSKRLFFKISNKQSSEANYSILLESYSNNFVLELMESKTTDPRYAKQITHNREEIIESNARLKKYNCKFESGEEKIFFIHGIKCGSQSNSYRTKNDHASFTILLNSQQIFKAELINKAHDFATRHPKYCHINNPYLPK